MDPHSTIVTGYLSSLGCTGSFVPVPTGSSCDDVALANRVSTDNLLMVNGLYAGCANWPAGLKKVCIEQSCTPYRIQENETCVDVSIAYNITLTQLVSWNPSVDPACANWNHKVGHIICISDPGNYSEPKPHEGGGPIPTNAAPAPTDAAKGSSSRCGKWYEIQPRDGMPRPPPYSVANHA